MNRVHIRKFKLQWPMTENFILFPTDYRDKRNELCTRDLNFGSPFSSLST